jgi:hypothetical protein
VGREQLSSSARKRFCNSQPACLPQIASRNHVTDSAAHAHATLPPSPRRAAPRLSLDCTAPSASPCVESLHALVSSVPPSDASAGHGAPPPIAHLREFLSHSPFLEPLFPGCFVQFLHVLQSSSPRHLQAVLEFGCNQ